MLLLALDVDWVGRKYYLILANMHFYIKQKFIKEQYKKCGCTYIVKMM
jgi:hypothetical protein